MLTGYENIGSVNLANPVNREHPLNRGRLAWWLTVPPLDGGSKWYDLINRNDMPITNVYSARVWSPLHQQGAFGSLNITTTSDIQGQAPGPVFSAPPMTIMAWVRVTSAGADQWIICENSHHGCLGLGGAAGNPLGYLWALTTDEYNAASGLVPVVGEWTLVALVVTASAATIYMVNSSGLSSWTNTKTHNTNTSSTWWLGENSTSTGQQWLGQLDDISIYNRTLSASEIKSYYDLSRMGYPGLLNRVPSQRMVNLPALSPVGYAQSGLSLSARNLSIGI